mmetsp:Transcript_47092/g.134003  ORF Transcript_47092/g.134003 Transcript_47092/m.134003 type:complete len:325 (+) Transcript_47092:689-1663(+)
MLRSWASLAARSPSTSSFMMEICPFSSAMSANWGPSSTFASCSCRKLMLICARRSSRTAWCPLLLSLSCSCRMLTLNCARRSSTTARCPLLSSFSFSMNSLNCCSWSCASRCICPWALLSASTSRWICPWALLSTSTCASSRGSPAAAAAAPDSAEATVAAAARSTAASMSATRCWRALWRDSRSATPAGASALARTAVSWACNCCTSRYTSACRAPSLESCCRCRSVNWDVEVSRRSARSRKALLPGGLWGACIKSASVSPCTSHSDMRRCRMPNSVRAFSKEPACAAWRWIRVVVLPSNSSRRSDSRSCCKAKLPFSCKKFE